LKPDLPADVFLSHSPERFRSLLLYWFDRNQRPLPWRRQKSLYGTWISEVMLQQTTVAVVVPYWEKFLAAFPDVRALAAAGREEVLSLWSGLGYYRRARNLHEAAKTVVSRWGGILPDDRESWLELPGIGPYAGGAIASIGLGIRTPALDANALRVLTRWLVAAPPALDDLRPAHLEKTGALLVDEDRPGDWNEALMELGSLICRASAPRCGACPVRDLCRAGVAGTEGRIPPPKVPVETIRVQLGLLVLTWRDRVLLMPPASGPAVVPPGSPAPVRRDVSGLHKGLWGLPSTPWLPDSSGGRASWAGSIWRPWLDAVPGLELPPGGEDPALLGKFRHAITRYRLVVQVYGLRLSGGLPPDGDDTLQSKKSRLQDRDLGFEGAKDVMPPPPRFHRWPPLNQPVSNLVKKSLVISEKTIV
jgi:A/G-specific adenine glycosylase